jgi:hypothetical protein
LLVGAKEFFQPKMKGLVAGIGLDDAGGVAELVIEFHDKL